MSEKYVSLDSGWMKQSVLDTVDRTSSLGVLHRFLASSVAVEKSEPL